MTTIINSLRSSIRALRNLLFPPSHEIIDTGLPNHLVPENEQDIWEDAGNDPSRFPLNPGQRQP